MKPGPARPGGGGGESNDLGIDVNIPTDAGTGGPIDSVTTEEKYPS